MNAKPNRLWILILLICVNRPGMTVAEEEFDPGATVSSTVTFIEKYHVSRKKLDDELSRKWLSTFLNRLDPQRVYFLKSDLEEFRKVENQLDDFAKAGDFRFPELVRTRYRKRLGETVLLVEKLLAQKPDFTINEECPIRFEEYSQDLSTWRERWRLWLKSQILIEKLHGQKVAEVKAQLRNRYRRIHEDAHAMTDERLCQIFLDSLTHTLDPHSMFLSTKFLESFNQTISFRTYYLPFRFRYRSGYFQITSAPVVYNRFFVKSKFLGWNLLSIRRVDGKLIDVVEMHPEDFFTMISQPFDALGDEREVILELFHPLTLKRQTVSCQRFHTR